MNDIVTIRHDAFGRYSVIRRCVRTTATCDWCGQNRKGHLFQYGTENDGIYSHPNWSKGKFCSKACHDITNF